MKFLLILIFAVSACAAFIENASETQQNENAVPTPTPTKKMKYDRLPPNITAETEVLSEVKNSKGEIVSSRRTTAEKKLDELKARYKKGKLVDAKGREIKFFEPFCRGVSAGFEQDERDRKEKERELAELRKKYTVIVLFCDPLKVM